MREPVSWCHGLAPSPPLRPSCPSHPTTPPLDGEHKTAARTSEDGRVFPPFSEIEESCKLPPAVQLLEVGGRTTTITRRQPRAKATTPQHAVVDLDSVSSDEDMLSTVAPGPVRGGSGGVRSPTASKRTRLRGASPPSSCKRALRSSASSAKHDVYPQRGTAQRRMRSDDFIGYRAVYVDDDTWPVKLQELNTSPFTERPSLEELLDHALTVRRPHFRQLKPYQQIIRENYKGAPEGRYTGALAFFSESDKAFSELKRCLKRPPPDNNKPKREAAAASSSKQPSTGASGKGGVGVGGGKPRRLSPVPVSDREGDTRPASPAGFESDSSFSIVSSTVQEEQEQYEGGSGNSSSSEQATERPRSSGVEVTDNDVVLIHGKPLAQSTRVYSLVFGKAFNEKASDPDWRIGPGIVDRCYYRGARKNEAKRVPGHWFPTDQALLADFFRRRPNILAELGLAV